MATRPYSRRGDMTLESFVSSKFYWDAEEFWGVTLVIAVILAIGSTAAFALMQSDENTHVSHHQHTAQALFSDGDHANDPSADARQKRRDMARNIVAIQTLDGFDINMIETGDLDQIKKIQETGDPIRYNDYSPSWGTDFFSGWWLHHLLPLGIMVILIFIFISYVLEADEQHQRIADLPWRKPWAWGFVALTLVPFGWFAYPISLLLIHGDNKLRSQQEAKLQREREERETEYQRRQEEYQAREAEYQANREHHEEPPPEPPPKPVFADEKLDYTFVPAPKSAKAAYFDLRTGFQKLRRAKRLDELQGEESGLVESLKGLGQEIKEKQRQVGEVRTGIKTLQAEPPPSMEPSDRLRIEAEFDRILASPSVEAVRVINDEISILVKPRYDYRGKRYHLGDWEIRFGDPERGNNLYTYCLQVGAHEAWLERGWQYPLYGQRDAFCFGDRASEISRHLSKGQFAEAVELAIESLHTINPTHQEYIPQAFQEVAT